MRINHSTNRGDAELLEMIDTIVMNARRGEYSDAASKMNIFLQKLQVFLTSGKIDPNKLKNVTYSLETVLMLQEQKDWVAVADILEFELKTLLN